MNSSAVYVLLCYIFVGIAADLLETAQRSQFALYFGQSDYLFYDFCGLLLLLSKQWPQVQALRHDKRQRKLLAWGSILITINWGSYIFAVNSGHILDASLAYYLNPIMVILLGAIFFW